MVVTAAPAEHGDEPDAGPGVMDDNAYERWLARIGLPDSGRELVTAIRRSEPVRRVRSGAKNMTVRFWSRKMGRVIQAESVTVERPAIYSYELDQNVLEYWDQPCFIPFVGRYRSGKRYAYDHVPDFLVLKEPGADRKLAEESSVGFEEWKREDQLLRLEKDKPWLITRDQEGHWRCAPGEEWAASRGLYYRIRSSRELDRVVYENLMFLEDYITRPDTEVDPVTELLIRRRLQGRGHALLKEVLEWVA
jgi:putative transposase